MTDSQPRAHVTLRIDASPEQAFDAWIEPATMEQWLFKSQDNSLRAATDPRPGGSYSIVETQGGEIIDHTGVYSVVDRATHLAFSLVVPKHFAGTAQIDVRFHPEDDGTRLELVATADGPDDAQPIWEWMLGNLAHHFNR